MKKKKTELTTFFLLLTLSMIFSASNMLQLNAQDSSKSILILNSYHKGLSWTDSETDGIMNIIDSYNDDAKIYVEYMDWKNHPTKNNLSNLYDSLSYKYSGKKLDVIITTDDAALEFALDHRAALFQNAPIVFCGINEEGISRLTKGHSGVTGVKEIIDPEGTLRAALNIYPELEEIYLLYDNTESGISTGKMTIEAAKRIKPDIRIRSLNTLSIKEILTEAAKASDNSMLLITTYYVDVTGYTVGFEDFSRKVSEISRVPVFHLYDFGLGNGAIGGSMMSGKLQGEAAGKLAVRIMQGEAVDRIIPTDLKTTSFMFDYMQLERFSTPLDKLPEGSIIINRPFSFLEEYRSYVITAGIVFGLLLLFIISLSFYLIRISIIRSQLEQSHEELVASESELKRQLDEIVRVQHNLDESETRYLQLFEKMLNGFAIVEPLYNTENEIYDIRIVRVNPRFQDQIGMKDVDITGKAWLELFNYPNKNLGIYRDILATGQARHYDTYYPDIDIYYSANAFKVSDNRIGVVFDNITEYKLAIKEIKKLNEELEQRVVERTEELQSAVDELESFAYTVSHDLKSPIRAVEGYMRILREDYNTKLDDEGKEIMENMRSICKEMIEMINKLLAFSTTSKSIMVKEEIMVEELFRSVYKELMLSNADRDIEMTVETGMPIVSADRVMLRLAINNLLSNAIKYTRNVEKASIAIGCTITGCEYVFYIRDNGAGFDMEYASKLFGIFQRLHSNDEFEGNGIGLVTVKKVIQKHGGRVWIEGRPEMGATVYFTLPLKQK